MLQLNITIHDFEAPGHIASVETGTGRQERAVHHSDTDPEVEWRDHQGEPLYGYAAVMNALDAVISRAVAGQEALRVEFMTETRDYTGVALFPPTHLPTFLIQ